MKLKKLFLIICTICFTVALACVAAACGDAGGEGGSEVIPVVSVELDKSELSLVVGSEGMLEAKINPRNATDLSVTWKSSNTSVATVEGGKVTAVAVGEATITVTASGKKASCLVTVTEKQVIHVNSVTLTQHSIEMLVDGTYTNLLTTILPANATETDVTWTSSDPDCVTVSNKGHLKAISVGTAIITAEVDGKSDRCTVTVNDVADSIELSDEELEINLGETKTITATVKPEEKSFVVVWTSSNNNVATVDNGTITPVSEGTATITAKAGGKSATCKVTVKDNAVSVTSIKLDKGELALTVGDTETLKATVDPEEAASAVVWESSDENVATVVGGVVTAVNPGTATITAAAGGKSDTCEVTVSASIADNSIVTYAHAGEESAAFEWKDNNAKGAKVEYKLSSENSYKQIDSELVREISSGIARADIVGLKGGEKYDFKITSSSGQTVYALKVDIAKLDRSGFAHYNSSNSNYKYSGGVGAYNDDGTLKSNAVVIYLTEDNKNSVKDGKSIAEYLADAKSITSKTPIVIRVIGTVGCATWGDDLKYPKPAQGKKIDPDIVVGKNGKKLIDNEGGLSQAALIEAGYNSLNLHPATEKGLYVTKECAPIRGIYSSASYDSSKKEYDSCWNDCQVSEAKNITVEGIGEDAEIFQWGFTFKKCNSIEVRNLRFYDYTEDACSFEGNQGKITDADEFTYQHFWVHHNVFDLGVNHWDICGEQDKGDGDGATDFKKLSYVTVAYNQYNYTHKTGLVGGDDAHYQASFTFHHNYYNGCDQRMPLGRQANMHLYNNYYSSSGLYSISLRAGAYAYIENCVFTSKSSSTKPIELLSNDKDLGRPSAKVVDCDVQGTIDNKISGINNLFQGSRANVTNVEGDNLYGLNFEKNLPYTVTGKLDTDKVAETIPKVAGTLKRLSNIKIDGSSQGDGTGGGDIDNPKPPATFESTVTKSATIDVADLVKDGVLEINTNSHSLDKPIADGIAIKSSNAKVTTHNRTIEEIAFTHRIVIKGTGDNYIAVTTGGACTIKFYVANGSSTAGKRTIGLYTDTAAKNAVGSTTDLDAGETALLEYNVTKAGTYYLESITNELGIYRIDLVVSEGTGGDSGNTDTYTNVSVTFDKIAKTADNPNGILEPGDGATYDLDVADGIHLHMTGKVNTNSKTVDGTKYNYRVVLKGSDNYFEITTQAKCTIKIYVVNGGSSAPDRVLGLYNGTTTDSVVETKMLAPGDSLVADFQVNKGTFYLQSPTNELSIYRIDIIYS